MVELPTSALPQFYTQFMEQIKVRLEAVARALHNANAQRDNVNGFLQAEFACLQIRRVTELVAVAVLVAHNQYESFRTAKLTKEWNPDALFSRLTRLNKEGFPLPFEMGETDSDGIAEIFIQDSCYLNRESFCRIYHDCSRLLHAGSLKDMIEGKTRYDLGVIQEWRKQLMRLLNNHLILLPERKRTMIVLMAKAPDENVQCVLHEMAQTEELGSPPRVTRRYRSVAKKPGGA